MIKNTYMIEDYFPFTFQIWLQELGSRYFVIFSVLHIKYILRHRKIITGDIGLDHILLMEHAHFRLNTHTTA